MNEDGFDLRGILPMRDGAPPSELVVRSLRGDPEPLLAWQTERIEKLEQEVEILRQEMKMLSCNLDPDATIVRQVDLLNAAEYGTGDTPEGALADALADMLECAGD